VGDPCKGDVDCAGNMRCMVQFDEKTFLSGPGGSCSTSSDCCTGGTCSSGTCQGGVCVTRYRNGYCTIGGCTVSSSLTSCPYGSTCNKAYFAGMCQKTCSLSSATDCRNHSADYLGDYECRAWDQLSFSSQPVCDFGDLFTCATLSAAGIACGDLGTSGNPTNMSCRDLNNTTLTSSSATGFCLDDTASGPVLAP